MMKTLLLVCITILGVLGGPAISNNGPEFEFWKTALAAIDQLENAGQSSMEQQFAQAAASNKDLETIAWNEIHPQFKSYVDALVKVNRGLRKRLAPGKSELQPQERQELIALTSDVLKTRKNSDTVAVASGWTDIYNTLNKSADAVTVTFCTDADFFGECFELTLHDGCNYLPDQYNDEISSGDTHGGCAIVYKDVCSNDYLVMSDTLGTGYVSYFGDYNMNDKISSFAGC